MQLLSFARDGIPVVGVMNEGIVHALDDLVPGAPSSMIDVIAGGDDLASQIADAIEDAQAGLGGLEELDLLPVVPNPGKVVCLGLNYAEHAKEGGRDVPTQMTLFLRANSSMAAHGETIPAPEVSDKIDYEAELAIIIGKRAKRVDVENALDFVYGYAPFNDISVRDYQRRSSQWTAGKNFDRTGPLGPVLATKDELPRGAAGLSIRSILNGNVMQDGTTSDMIFDVARIVADVSECMTLEPGDVIVTGTPSGVGFARKPPVFMKAGDRIEIEIEGLPRLVNTMG
ncbi:fumarylacetoacetate hydrolase family protein [Rhodovulum sulfidophilum]|uniref:fumarylacetoacetate hydrolase family protein n=1 Tax=Rhodovulum sulfidophilum TaxID=35806 RepID=UPI00192186D2|nr:fumarylacetoacetate hydrolase family protein [Rhodovulum sulfidophilum]MBL3575546.1 fumarylacetoacetate hydrolase family protein [Rhodovulum sulfidophilum]MCE8432743.1 fumarylacetoacetate hydrolase family protein [Rhodovulum sulfidophilum]MCF4118621.1 fumarylacetoacetate hydrolase family protein [Rhodovulum sulfidophilum]